jgi:hypothetical protein
VTTSASRRPESTQRLDAPSRVKEGMAVARDTVVETYRESPPVVLGAVAAVIVVVVSLVVWRRKR